VAVAATLAIGAASYGVTAAAADTRAASASGDSRAAVAMILATGNVRFSALEASSARPKARATHPATASRPSVRSAAPARSAARSAAPARSAVRTMSCSATGGLLPDNVSTIVSFLVNHGYSDNAAAGIAGNIYQESKGNPESAGMGGGGLIGFTPLPAGYQTGDPAADLQTQLSAILTFNQQWSGYLPQLNAASSPAAAAGIYVTDFERAGLPETGTREASARDVAAACGL
jgi:hypothetical protein